MSVRSSTRALAVTATLLAALAIASYLVFPPGRNASAREISVLDPRVTARVASLEISSPGDDFRIVLRKRGGSWFLVLDPNRFWPAQSGQAESFIGILSEKRKVSSTGSADGRRYGIGDTGSYSVRVTGDDGTILGDISFGSVSPGGVDRYFRTGRSHSVLRTDDAFSPYLDLRASVWAELEIFRSELDDTSVQHAVVDRGGTGAVVPAAKLDALTGVLRSFRCLDVTNIPSVPEETWKIDLGNAGTLRFGIAPLDGEVWILTVLDTGASYTISRWARERLEKTAF